MPGIVWRIIIIVMLLAAPVTAQESRPSGGQAAVDPTENVKALNAAEAKRQDDLRSAEAKYQNAMRDAETRRINELAMQKTTFDLELARVLRANVDASTLLLATQLKEVKTDLSDRTAKLEQYRYETGGRGVGQSDVIGWIVAAFMALVAGGTLLVNYSRKARP